MRGKKGGERILSIWWILVVTIVGVFIVGGVIIFYSSWLDVRGSEAEILITRVADCLADEGKLNFEAESLNKDKILSECKLNAGILNSEKYYLKVSIVDKTIEIGNPDFEKYCKLKGENYPVCKERELYVLSGGENIKMKILASLNNQGRKLT